MDVPGRMAPRVRSGKSCFGRALVLIARALQRVAAVTVLLNFIVGAVTVLTGAAVAMLVGTAELGRWQRRRGRWDRE